MSDPRRCAGAELNHVAQSLPEVPYGELYWLLAKVDANPPFHIGVIHAPWSIHLGRLEYYAALVDVAGKWRLGRGAFIGDMNTGVTGLDEETENSVEYHKSVMKPLEDNGATCFVSITLMQTHQHGIRPTETVIDLTRPSSTKRCSRR